MTGRGTTTTPEQVVPELIALADVVARRGRLEAEFLETVAAVAAACASRLLEQRGASDPDELSRTAREAWRSDVKRYAAVEVMHLLGVGSFEARQYVGLALAPRGVRDVVTGAVRRGHASLVQARSFWSAAGRLPLEDGAAVAVALFGADPATAAPERLAPDGQLPDRIMGRKDFQTALDREIAAVEGRDVAGERARRRLAYAARRVSLEARDDGTGALVVTGDLVNLIGVHTRVDRAARLLRRSGDPRTLDQLRSDVIAALLLHGTLPTEENEESGDEAQVDDERVRRLAQIVNGVAGLEVQVVMPWDVLQGAPTENRTQSPDLPPDRPPSDHPPPGGPPPDDPPSGPVDPVGRVIGPVGGFLSPGRCRELLLEPGTTLTRLLTDPADGRLIERTVAGYRPDAAMRRQIIAADVFSRAPGSTVPARDCELDHVVPYGGPGGLTRETNLVALNKGHHDHKTLGRARAAINDRRDLDWATMLGQALATRVHDYRSYAPHRPMPAVDRETLLAEIDPDLATELTRHRPPGVDPVELTAAHDRHNLALYAALAHRGRDAFLVDDDDEDDGITDVDQGPGTRRRERHRFRWLHLTHQCPVSGRRRDGPPKDLAPPESHLGLPPAPTDPTESAPASTTSTGRTTAWERPRTDPPPF